MRIAVLFGVLGVAVGLPVPQTALSNGSTYVGLRDSIHSGTASLPVLLAYNSTIEEAKKLIQGGPWSFNTGPWSVLNKTIAVPAGVSRHEYLSIGIYNHPCNNLPAGCKPYPNGHLLPPQDCDNTTGLPWEPCDGLRNPSAIEEGDAPRHDKMADAVKALGLALYLCKEDTATCEAFEAKAAQVMRTWFLDNSTAMLPDLYYGQIDPKPTPPAKGHGGFIEWSTDDEFLDGVALLNAASSGTYWTADDQAALKAWYKQLEVYVEGPVANGEREMANNHGSWFDATWGSLALFTGNTDSAVAAANESCWRRIATQILPNGTEWIEVQRASPAGYCIYNLAALSHNADLAAFGGVGIDVWRFETADGRSLAKALDWLLVYALGKEKWPYPQLGPESWTSLAQVTRRAANALGSKTYEEATCQLLGGRDTYANFMVLSNPPTVTGVKC